LNHKHNIAKAKVLEYFQLNQLASDDLILRKIHLRRLKEEMPAFCKAYLLEVFINTHDVRFFNEYLWLNGKEGISKRASANFKNNIDENGHYKYCYHDELKFCLALKEDSVQLIKNNFENISVALIGSPFHFISAHKRLKRLGIQTDVVNVKYKQSKLRGLILENVLISRIYRLIFGRKNYFEINISNKQELKNIKLPRIYDIGFHKLGFIIPENLINQFSRGLINDHWGALPLFKGRSTLEYSRLFGANLVVTNHLVRPKIDSGSILCFTSLSPKGIKRDIYFGLGSRIVKSLNILAAGQIKKIDNEKGKMFYEMHPRLLDHVKKISRSKKG
jgi:folate-dependent phosphoribosylglycinamide formyltransferase PurN